MAEIWSPTTPGGVAWVPIDRLDEYLAERGHEHPLRNFVVPGRLDGVAAAVSGERESLAEDITQPGRDDRDDLGDGERDVTEEVPTVLQALGISVGAFRTGQPTNIAEHKDEYLADAFESKG